MTSLFIQPEVMEKVNEQLQAKYKEIEKNEVRFETINCDDADVVIVGYGLSARIGSKVMSVMRSRGIKVGLVKPITLWPYPYQILTDLSKRVKGLYVMELNAGQMIEDVRLAVEGRARIGSYNRMGGMIFSPDEVVEHMERFCKELGL